MKRFLALLGAVALAAGCSMYSGCAIMPVYPEVPGLDDSHDQLIAHLGASIQEVVKGTRGATYQLQLASVKETTTGGRCEDDRLRSSRLPDRHPSHSGVG